MAALIAQNLAPIMFAALVVFLLLGYPVAFALAANGLLFFFIAVELAPLAPETITLSWPLLQALPDRIFGTMSNEVLLAIPFFTFMGLVLERSGMAEDLLDTIGQLFGPVRGGLAYAVIFVGALLAATTGVVAASVISMGLISLPIMLRYGYDRRLASGVIAASGTLAQIIPPSLVLIVMADQLGRSVGDMYEGAFLPGLILTGLYAAYIMMMSIVFPKSAPGLPPEAIGYREPDGARGVWQLGILVVFSGFVGYYVMSQTGTKAGADFVILTICVATVVALICALMNKMLGAKRIAVSAVLTAVLVALYAYLHSQGHEGAALAFEMILAGTIYALIVGIIERFTGLRLMSNMAQQVTFVMVPPLLLIFLVLGTIFIGLATPTEGGAMGALGSVILAAVKRKLDNNPARFNWTLVRQATEATAKLSAFVLFILIGARVFSLTFYGVNGHIWVEHLLTSLPGGQVGFLVFVNILVFFLAFFLDYFELAFIIIPLLGPAADKLGIDLIWFGVILAVNMQTSFMHPPFGFALFFLRSVAPKLPYIDRVTGKKMEPVTTGQIYWGAVPFVCIQLIMVAIVIAFPQIVMHYKAAGPTVDPAAVQKKLDELLVPGLGAPGSEPGGLPGLNFDEPPKIQ
ncbi:TRAP transporter large permease [Microvirga lotononidis]|uniref:TRAP-type mannitol/chloroaromatic compound transport system, large permease component n=1 Tax=Microvirga lotononidis TaxID=864069 RepID=I4Z028_9HYPH|nr:TRAP transporter large permease subunit [Microvirga lotononidis]EIM29570.1 TRAP-type mannitol/chloroaromatic compound transport system, large permease component [Microvirga lotononidis]WQO27123.1 TRAP transporter large permease subunit [Microvirga lotononidis]